MKLLSFDGCVLQLNEFVYAIVYPQQLTSTSLRQHKYSGNFAYVVVSDIILVMRSAYVFPVVDSLSGWREATTGNTSATEAPWVYVYDTTWSPISVTIHCFYCHIFKFLFVTNFYFYFHFPWRRFVFKPKYWATCFEGLVTNNISHFWACFTSTSCSGRKPSRLRFCVKGGSKGRVEGVATPPLESSQLVWLPMSIPFSCQK